MPNTNTLIAMIGGALIMNPYKIYIVFPIPQIKKQYNFFFALK